MQLAAMLYADHVSTLDQGVHAVYGVRHSLELRQPTERLFIFFFQVFLEPDEALSPHAFQFELCDPDLKVIAASDPQLREPVPHSRGGPILHTCLWGKPVLFATQGTYLTRVTIDRESFASAPFQVWMLGS